MTFDSATVVVLLLGVGLGFALAGVLPRWRRLMSGGHDLPVWGFLARRGASVEGRAALQAEVRCEVCSSHAQCRERLASGSADPVPGCPNEALFRSVEARGAHPVEGVGRA